MIKPISRKDMRKFLKEKYNTNDREVNEFIDDFVEFVENDPYTALIVDDFAKYMEGKMASARKNKFGWVG